MAFRLISENQRVIYLIKKIESIKNEIQYLDGLALYNLKKTKRDSRPKPSFPLSLGDLEVDLKNKEVTLKIKGSAEDSLGVTLTK